jgi:ribosomal protein L28
MARTCPICERGANNANSRSHSNIATKRMQHVNIQTMLVKGKRVKACTSCIRGRNQKNQA